MAAKGAEEGYVSLDTGNDAHYYRALQIDSTHRGCTNNHNQDLHRPAGYNHMQASQHRAVSNPYSSGPRDHYGNNPDYHNIRAYANNEYYNNSNKTMAHTYDNKTPMQATGHSPYSKDETDIYENDHELTEEKLDVYEEIPGDRSEHSFGSTVSIRSTSSVQPILEPTSSQDKSHFRLAGRKLCLLVVVIVVILLVVIIAVAVGVSTKSKDRTEIQPQTGQTTDEATPRAAETTGTTSAIETTKKTSAASKASSTTTVSPLLSTSTSHPDTIPVYGHDTNTMVIVDHPRPKVRIVGDSVTLCCQATGSPAPQYYDWLLDDQVLMDHRDLTNSTSSLRLTNLQLSESGYYSCRATNEYVSVVSDQAYLQVQDPSDSFCPSAPMEWLVTLPHSCSYNGQSTYNVGRCPDKLCRGTQADANNCVDSQPFCCGPTQYEDIMITCDGDELIMNVIKSCGCVHCEHTLYNIIGVAQSSDGTSRFSNGHIYLRNMSTTANDRMTDIGVFRLNLQQNAHRLVLVTENTYDRDQFYNRSSHILHLPNSLSGSFYMSADLRYIPKTSEIIRSTQTFSKDLKFQNGEQLIHIEMPGGNYYHHGDQRHFGDVEISSNLISGQDLDALQAAPGDFMFIGADGQQHYIMAYGLFAIEVKNSTGSLHYNNSFQITIESNHITNISMTRLWRLGRSGYWHVEDRLHTVANRKRKRKSIASQYDATIDGIEDGLAWFAVAKISDLDVCVSKIRVYDKSTSADASQLQGVQTMVIVHDQHGAGMISMQRAVTDEGDNNGYCIMHPCSSNHVDGLKGYIRASYEGKLLHSIAQINSEPMKIDEIASKSVGPTYFLSEKESCSRASAGTSVHVTFFGDTCERSLDAVSPPRSFVNIPCKAEYYRIWHTPEEHRDHQFTSCHMKIYAPGSNGTLFHAINSVGNSNNSNLRPGQVYGVREDCTNEMGVVCLQVKAGGFRKCHAEDDTGIEDLTNVTVSALSGTWKIEDIDQSLKRKANILSVVGDSKISLNLYESGFGRIYGIYCADDFSATSARWRSQRQCLSGNTDDISIGIHDVSPRYYAFKMITIN